MKSHFAFALAIVCLIHSSILAQTFNPTTGTEFWNQDSNWSSPPFPNSSGAAATIPAATGDLTIDLGIPITVGSLAVNKSSGNFPTTIGVGASNTLTIDGGTSNLSNGNSAAATGTTTIAAPIVLGPGLASSNFTISQNGPNTLQLTGGISGTGNLVINRDTNGTGAALLGAANSYSGTTILTGGSGTNFLLVRLDDVNAIPGGIDTTGGTSNIQGTNAVIFGLSASDFTRGVGTGINQMSQFNGTGSQGWAAFGQDRAVNLFGDGRKIIWGNSGAFFGNLTLGHTSANRTIDFQNELDLNTGGNNVNRNIRIEDGSAAIDAIISGPIVVGSGTGNLTFQAGGTVSLTAANTYTTYNTLLSNATTVILNNASALPSSNLSFAGNSILGLGTDNDSFTRSLGTGADQVQFTAGGGFAAFGGNKTVNLGGAGATIVWGAGGNSFVPGSNNLTLSADNASGTLDFQNPLDLNGGMRNIAARNGSAAIDAVLTGGLSDSGSGGGLTKSQDGTLQLVTASSYTGNTVISGGSLRLDHADALSANTQVNLQGGGVIGLGIDNDVFTRTLGSSAGQVSTSGTGGGFAAYGGIKVVRLNNDADYTVVWGTAGLFNSNQLVLSDGGADGTVDFQNKIDLNGAARTIQVRNGSAAIDGIISGVISGDSASGFTKTNPGTLELTADNTYGGTTTINSGRLLVNNSTGSGTGSGAVVVSGGTLGGTGSISGAVTVNSGARIAPGASIESLDVGSLTVNTGSFLDFELGAPGSPGVTSDLINVITSGGLTLNGGSVVLTNAGGLAAGTYTLIDYAGTLNGDVLNLGTPTPLPGFTFALSNNVSNSSIDLQVTAAGLPGDFNSDGKVDAGDYVTWRKNDGTNNALANDNGLGTPVGPAHYTLWRANFGNPPGTGSGGGLGGAEVPEPGTLVFVCLFVPLFVSRRLGRVRA